MSFYLVNKPINYTSFDVIKILRGKFKTSRIGHTGTLDPLAEGCLLIAIGNYTKLIPYFEKDTKEYLFSINIDGISDSYDKGTEIFYLPIKDQEKAIKTITKEIIEKCINENFLGEIEQIPPKYSAIKIGGKKALNKVLDGEKFNMKSRKCIIYEIEVLNYKYPQIDLKAKVSAGTYIRSIANDLGQILGTGGYISKLIRTKIGDLNICDSQSIIDFDLSKKIDDKKLFKNGNFIILEDDIIKQIDFGLKVKGKYDYKINTPLFVISGAKISNIVEYDGEFLIPKRKI